TKWAQAGAQSAMVRVCETAETVSGSQPAAGAGVSRQPGCAGCISDRALGAGGGAASATCLGAVAGRRRGAGVSAAAAGGRRVSQYIARSEMYGGASADYFGGAGGAGAGGAPAVECRRSGVGGGTRVPGSGDRVSCGGGEAMPGIGRLRGIVAGRRTAPVETREAGVCYSGASVSAGGDDEFATEAGTA